MRPRCAGTTSRPWSALYTANGVFMREDLPAAVGQEALRTAYGSFATLKVDVRSTSRRPRCRASSAGRGRCRRTVKALATGADRGNPSTISSYSGARAAPGRSAVTSMLPTKPRPARRPVELRCPTNTTPSSSATAATPSIANGRSLTAGEGFGFLSDLMVDGEGHVHVAQRGMDQPVLVFERDGRQVGSWGEGALAEPHYINAAPDGGSWWPTATPIRCCASTRRQARAGAGQAALAVARRALQPSDGGGAGAGRRDLCRRRLRQFQRPSLRRGRQADRHLGRPGAGPGAFTTPHAIWVDRFGKVLVGDRENNRVQVFDREGAFLAEWGDFYHPMQIWVDDRDMVFVTDQIPRISLLTPTASWSAAAAAPSTAPTVFPAMPTATSILPSCRRRRSPSSSDTINELIFSGRALNRTRCRPGFRAARARRADVAPDQRAISRTGVRSDCTRPKRAQPQKLGLALSQRGAQHDQVVATATRDAADLGLRPRAGRGQSLDGHAAALAQAVGLDKHRYAKPPCPAAQQQRVFPWVEDVQRRQGAAAGGGKRQGDFGGQTRVGAAARRHQQVERPVGRRVVFACRSAGWRSARRTWRQEP